MESLFLSLIMGTVSGLISGILASILAQFIVHSNKPKIKISEVIAEEFLNGKSQYRFKIVNKSHHYAKNLFISVQLISKESAADGVLITTKPIKLVREDIKYISPYSKKDTDKGYAVRFMLDCDLRDIWKDDKYTVIEISVYCENEQNGAGKMFKQIIYKKQKIIKGTFKTGESLEIEEAKVEI